MTAFGGITHDTPIRRIHQKNLWAPVRPNLMLPVRVTPHFLLPNLFKGLEPLLLSAPLTDAAFTLSLVPRFFLRCSDDRCSGVSYTILPITEVKLRVLLETHLLQVRP